MSLRVPILAILLSFMTVMLCGLVFSMPMHDPNMSGCSSGYISKAICSMNPLEHFAAWQKSIATNKPLNLAVLILVLVSAYVASKIKDNIPRIRATLAYSHRRIPPGPLAEAFARGILHSKVH